MLFLYLLHINCPDVSKTLTGLGNNLFELASQYSISKKYNIEANYYYLYKFIKQLEELGLNNYDKTIFRNLPINNIKQKTDIILSESKKAYIYDERLINNIINNSNKNILIKNSYLQSIKYFDEYKQDIQNLFSPDDKSLEFIYNKYPLLKKDSVINVSIHLRLEWGNQIKYNVNYFKNSIQYIENKLRDTNSEINYFVFSDNIYKAKKMLSQLNKTFVYCENNFDYIDLWIMSLCKHNIICHSTFGWWGAYLNKNKEKLVLYPSFTSYFYSKITKAPKELVQNNYLPNDWIPIKM